MSLQKTLWVWSLTCHYANACQHLCIEVFKFTKFTHKPAIGSTRKALRYSSLLTNQSRLNPKSLKFHYIISHRIHGAGIYGNMDPINIPPLCLYIYQHHGSYGYDNYLPFALPDKLSLHIAIFCRNLLAFSSEGNLPKEDKEGAPSHLLSLPTKMVMDQNWGATYQIGPAFTSYNILNLIRSIRIYSVY